MVGDAMALRRTSLRRVLLLGISTTAVLAALLTVYLSRHFLNREADELLDAQLARSARVFDAAWSSMSAQDRLVFRLPDDAIALHSSERTVMELGGRGHAYELHVALQIFSTGGQLLARSANAPTTPITALQPGFHDTAEGWRAFVLESRDGTFWILVAEDDHARHELAVEFSATGILVTLAGFGLLILVLLYQVERALAPVRRLARDLAGRDPGDFEPVTTGGLPDEILPLVASLNRHLARLQRAFRREQDFTARAAHELRTPLAALRIHAENALTASQPEEQQESLQSLRAGIERASRLIDQLLALTRVDVEQFRQRFIRVDGADLLNRARKAHLALAMHAGIEIECSAVAPLPIDGDIEFLLIALDTLISNAILHARSGRRITLRANRSGGRVRLEVRDEGPGLAPAELDRLNTECAVPESGDRARLGLTIAAWIAHIHSGRLTLENRSDGPGLTVAIDLPTPQGPTAPCLARSAALG
jgi:two-component system sensor histidine kinase QseC